MFAPDESGNNFMWQKLSMLILCGMVALLVTACGGNSDAVNILQSENTALRATLESYQSVGPTATAQFILVSQRQATSQSELATLRAQVQELTSRLNSQTSPQTQPIQPVSPDVTTVASNAMTPTPAGTGQPTGLAFDQVITTKGKDGNGCAVGESNIFAVGDQIWVITKVMNLKGNIAFTAKWTGAGISDQYSWTVTNNGTPICVHFYIEGNTLKAGDYTVTLSAPGATSAAASFKVQAAGEATPKQ